MPKMDLETRRRRCVRVTLDDLIEGLRRVGIHEGDTIFCHSSLSKFGYVEGGAETVVEALLRAAGPVGTVASAAGQPSADLGPNPVFDVLNTPSRRGIISEAIRRRATGRSHHLVDSISALGPAAEYLTSTHSVTNCGAESPYQKLMTSDAQILLLGVSHNSNTTFEAIEEEMARLIRQVQRASRSADHRRRGSRARAAYQVARLRIPLRLQPDERRSDSRRRSNRDSHRRGGCAPGLCRANASGRERGHRSQQLCAQTAQRPATATRNPHKHPRPAGVALCRRMPRMSRAARVSGTARYAGA